MSSLTIKLIGLITMLIDHTAVAFPTRYYMLSREIGRTAFPLFCFLLVEGFYHTKNRIKYIKNIFVFAIISEIPFDLIVFGEITLIHQNVMFTLLLGLITLLLLEKISEVIKGKFRVISISILQFLVVLVILFSAIIIKPDYGVRGVFLIILIYYFRKVKFTSFANPNIFMALAILLWLMYYDYSDKIINEIYGVVSAVLVLFYNGEKGNCRLPKYFFYAFYPLHLTILYLLKQIILF